MKRIFSIILIGILAVSCYVNPQPNGQSSTTRNGDYNVKVIDSCEYIEYEAGFVDNRVYSLTHKGNCKYCIQRNK